MVSTLTEIPDHLLAEIFLRLPAPDDLARASVACVTFRRIFIDGSFLRGFRRLHAPALFHPVVQPHPSAPAARALADFSFSFLPSHSCWNVQDTRDGRVLLNLLPEEGEEPPVFPELAMCDPLHRRYVLLPPVPDNLATSLEYPVPREPWLPFVPFLVPHGDKEEAAAAEEASFRVICMAHCKTKLVSFLFSSSTGQWRAAASKVWSDLGLGTDDSDMMTRVHPRILRRHYAYGCFYWDWLVSNGKKLLMLNTRRMEYSIVDLPPGEWSIKGVAIVEAGEGRLGMFRSHGEISSHLSYTIAQNKGESPSQWQMEKTISLASGYEYHIKAATERYLVLMRKETLPGTYPEYPLVEYLSMDVKTLQLQTVCAKQCTLMFWGGHIYTNFPPSLLSSRTI